MKQNEHLLSELDQLHAACISFQGAYSIDESNQDDKRIEVVWDLAEDIVRQVEYIKRIK